MSNTFHYNEVENGIELYLKKNNQKCSLNEWNGLTDVSQLEIVSIIENKVLENDPNFKKLSDNSGYFLGFDFVSSLSDQQSKAINLPTKLPFRMKINTKGNFTQSEFKKFDIYFKRIKSMAC